VAIDVTDMVDAEDALKTAARRKDGKIRLERECVDLVGVLRGAVESSMPVIDQGRHTLALDLPAWRPC